MKILVTGGAGFIGSHVADAYCNEGHEVVIVDNMAFGKEENINPKARFYQLDVTSDELTELIEKEKFDVINHHAAQMNIRMSVDDPAFDANTNIIGSLKIYEAARQNGVKKIIFASTGGAIYGDQDYFPADENHPQRPCSPYGIAKLANEKYLDYYAQVYGIQTVIFRYTNVFGPRQNPLGEAGVVAIFADKMLAGNQPIINGDGKNTRDYVYVSDLVRANVLALGDETRGIYNICTNTERDVNEIFHTLKEILRSDFDEYHGPEKKGEQRRSVCSYDKIKNDLGWQPEVDFMDGMRATAEFFVEKTK
jgi:UDP-glucose 4-epimerase